MRKQIIDYSFHLSFKINDIMVFKALFNMHKCQKWVDFIICTCWKGTFRISASEEVKENLDKLLKEDLRTL